MNGVRVSECVHLGESGFNCQDIYWVQYLDDQCTTEANAHGGGGWFSLTHCDDLFGNYTTYCTYADSSCWP